MSLNDYLWAEKIQLNHLKILVLELIHLQLNLHPFLK